MQYLDEARIARPDCSTINKASVLMGPDFLFVSFAGLSLIAAVAMAILAATRKSLRLAAGAALWLVLAAGLGTEGFAPNLQIDPAGKSAFIIPEGVAANISSPADLVTRERRMKMLAALLTAGAAIGLGLYYKPLLVKAQAEA